VDAAWKRLTINSGQGVLRRPVFKAINRIKTILEKKNTKDLVTGNEIVAIEGLRSLAKAYGLDLTRLPHPFIGSGQIEEFESSEYLNFLERFEMLCSPQGKRKLTANWKTNFERCRLWR